MVQVYRQKVPLKKKKLVRIFNNYHLYKMFIIYFIFTNGAEVWNNKSAKLNLKDLHKEMIYRILIILNKINI